MKKLIPILSIAVTSVCMCHCSNRDEEVSTVHQEYNRQHDPDLMRKDSAVATDSILDQDPADPPVRDGDNWRLYSPIK